MHVFALKEKNPAFSARWNLDKFAEHLNLYIWPLGFCVIQMDKQTLLVSEKKSSILIPISPIIPEKVNWYTWKSKVLW